LPIRECTFVILSYFPYLDNDGDLTDACPILTGNLSEDNLERLEEPTVLIGVLELPILLESR
jgi:hypothetical protein